MLFSLLDTSFNQKTLSWCVFFLHLQVGWRWYANEMFSWSFFGHQVVARSPFKQIHQLVSMICRATLWLVNFGSSFLYGRYRRRVLGCLVSFRTEIWGDRQESLVKVKSSILQRHCCHLEYIQFIKLAAASHWYSSCRFKASGNFAPLMPGDQEYDMT